MIQNLRFSTLVIIFVLSLIPVTAVMAQDDVENDASWNVPTELVTAVLDAEGNEVGLAALALEEEKIGLMVIVTGLPEGVHGIHVHEKGLCEAADDKAFAAAGSHFNPGGMTHPHHAGDMGNLEVASDGSGVMIMYLGVATFDDGEWGLADADGTALVIHESVDDLATDPSGNSGARIACAVLAAPTA